LTLTNDLALPWLTPPLGRAPKIGLDRPKEQRYLLSPVDSVHQTQTGAAQHQCKCPAAENTEWQNFFMVSIGRPDLLLAPTPLQTPTDSGPISWAPSIRSAKLAPNKRNTSGIMDQQRTRSGTTSLSRRSVGWTLGVPTATGPPPGTDRSPEPRRFTSPKSHIRCTLSHTSLFGKKLGVARPPRSFRWLGPCLLSRPGEW
jgi:hypothetical protein